MKTRGGAAGFGADRDLLKKLAADPCGPLGLDYRQIPVEHFLVGLFSVVGGNAQQ